MTRGKLFFSAFVPSSLLFRPPKRLHSSPILYVLRAARHREEWRVLDEIFLRLSSARHTLTFSTQNRLPAAIVSSLRHRRLCFNAEYIQVSLRVIKSSFVHRRLSSNSQKPTAAALESQIAFFSLFFFFFSFSTLLKHFLGEGEARVSARGGGKSC